MASQNAQEINCKYACFYKVFNHLNLQDQISCARSCQVFHYLLRSIWQKNYVTYSVYRDVVNTKEELSFLLENISNTVEHMVLGTLSNEKWGAIQLYKYPNVKSLYMWQPQVVSETDILRMTEIFPNLKTLGLKSPEVTGNHFAKWTSLQHLDLSNCSNLRFEHFEKILESSNLKSLVLGIYFNLSCIGRPLSPVYQWKSERAFKKFCELEEITLRSDELNCLSNLALYTNLRALNLLDVQNINQVLKLVKSVVAHKLDSLVELRASFNFPLEELFVKPLNNFKKLDLRWRLLTDFIDLPKYAPGLREISIRKCKGLKRAHVIGLLKCADIERVYIEDCKCDFDELKFKVSHILRDRTKRLVFNFFGNDASKDSRFYEEVKLHIEGESDLLKIISEDLDPRWICSTQLKFCDLANT